MLSRLRRGSEETRWPKTPEPLREREQAALEEWYQRWTPTFHDNHGWIARFNNRFVADLPLPPAASGARVRTLEIGAGTGEHVPFVDQTKQEYYSLELRPNFVEVLNGLLGPGHAVAGDIEKHAPWPDAYFDRVIAIHVLEHLRDLPAALTEIRRVLRPGGVLDVVLPCEGGALYQLGREFTSKRMFEKHFSDVSYERIIKSDHVSTYEEVEFELAKAFDVDVKRYFPLMLPTVHANVCVGLRVVRRPS